MPSFDASTATVTVEAFKEGLLSRVGHDVRLEVTSFTVEIDADGVTATFDPRSLRVLGAVRDGRIDDGALSAKDRSTIEGYVRNDILAASRFPTLRFEADEVDVDGDEADLEGELELHGVTHDLSVHAERDGDHWVAEVKLHQPDFGIRPFKALMGALKIKPGIRVTVRLPAAAL